MDNQNEQPQATAQPAECQYPHETNECIACGWKYAAHPAQQRADGDERARCVVPPAGWHCTRAAGHDGPCAAVPGCATCGCWPCGCFDRRAPQRADSAHSDNAAVDRFAAAMKAKMAASRAKGRSGWDNEALCPAERLKTMLAEHLAKGDPVDVGNFAMMLWNRGEPVAAQRADSALPVGASLLNADELVALRRFDECAQDGEGYDVPKEMMQRLAEIGVVQRRSGAYYQATEFGQRILQQAASQPAAAAQGEDAKDAARLTVEQIEELAVEHGNGRNGTGSYLFRPLALIKFARMIEGAAMQANKQGDA